MLFDHSEVDSYRAVERLSRRAGYKIVAATAHNILTGKSKPTRRSLIGFLHGCSLPPDEHQAWLDKHRAVYEGESFHKEHKVPEKILADSSPVSAGGHAKVLSSGPRLDQPDHAPFNWALAGTDPLAPTPLS
jgi:hypothetical protein